jgi:hypothetical protein
LRVGFYVDLEQGRCAAVVMAKRKQTNGFSKGCIDFVRFLESAIKK